MKVLLVGEDIRQARGGIATVIRMILEHPYLRAQGVQIRTLFPALPTGTFWQKSKHWLHGIPKFLFMAPRVDLIHLHHASGKNTFLSGFLVLLAKLCGCKIILHSHGADFREFYQSQSRLGKAFVRFVFKAADANIVLSKSWLHWYESLAPQARWIVLHNVAQIAPDRSMVASVNRDRPCFLFLGKLEERKGIYDLLEVIPEVLAEVPNAQFILAGDGDVEGVQHAVREMGIAANVSVPGWLSVDQKAEIFKKVGVFVLPSHNEGLPMALLETMAIGVVPVVTTVGGIPEVVIHNKNGLLIAPGDRQGLLKALLYLCRNDEARKKMAHNACLTIEERFSQDRYFRKLLQIYESLLRWRGGM